MRKSFKFSSLFTAVLLLVISAKGQTERVLYSFPGPPSEAPMAGLVRDSAGNLFGTTWGDGSGSSVGTVFELSQVPGGWQFNQLHVFQGPPDGAFPAASLIMDKLGNLYGTTEGGGLESGTVFELTPTGTGQWTEIILYSFSIRGLDGGTPLAALVFDAQGNLYGTTYHGGTYNYGTVFELAPDGNGNWVQTVLYSFKGGKQNDGAYPASPVVIDNLGNIFGATTGGGIPNHGVVFALSPNSGGQWVESILHSFAGTNDGNNPTGVVLNKVGDLFGATEKGGSTANYGTVFKLSQSSNGAWTESIIHRFTNDGAAYPGAPITSDGAGNLFGTTLGGGSDHGTVFRLALHANGNWTEKLFTFDGIDGSTPEGSVILDPQGNAYGTTSYGGTGYGVVFKIKP